MALHIDCTTRWPTSLHGPPPSPPGRITRFAATAPPSKCPATVLYPPGCAPHPIFQRPVLATLPPIQAPACHCSPLQCNLSAGQWRVVALFLTHRAPQRPNVLKQDTSGSPSTTEARDAYKRWAMNGKDKVEVSPRSSQPAPLHGVWPSLVREHAAVSLLSCFFSSHVPAPFACPLATGPSPPPPTTAAWAPLPTAMTASATPSGMR